MFVPTVLAARLRAEMTREFVGYIYKMRQSAMEKEKALPFQASMPLANNAAREDDI